MLSLSQLESEFSLVPKYNERLKGLRQKGYDVNWDVDWELLSEVGLYMTVEELLRQRYEKPQPNGNNNYCYRDWKELVNKDAYIFPELCLEFHSTYSLKEEPEDMNDKDFMRFRLGGKDRRMSLAEFTGCLKIYSPKRMDEQHFNDYIWSGARVSDIMNEEAFDPNSVWKEFGSSSSWPPRDGNKFPSTIDLDDINCRLLHMFLTLSIFHRAEDTDKVYLSDLWYLKQIRSKDTHVNIPYCVAYYLRHVAAADNPICGGHFVTLIADHFEVKLDESARFKKYPTGTISVKECEDAKVIYLWSSGIFLYDPDLKQPPPHLN
ncbi:uncharacterized protein [Rutidosis leptorrhynchoides]|uniref:uncharacterized protein n=1 Tax=Rutidosis leptorrhynchoides TaxID=125765 RepID=UPI003A99B2ED